MGGSGSGRRWHWDAAETTDDYRAIDVRRWSRDGFLEPGNVFGWQWTRNGNVTSSIRVRTESDLVLLEFRYRRGDGEWADGSHSVYLDRTPCHLGGQRTWFLCPARGCGRRVAILYGGRMFACRNCLGLAYPSQREPSYERAARRADRIREKLDWDPGIFNPRGWKPKGMHWKTFERLTFQYDVLLSRSLAGMAERFRLSGESLDDWI